jgi:hypothetical protein
LTMGLRMQYRGLLTPPFDHFYIVSTSSDQIPRLGFRHDPAGNACVRSV